MKQAELISQIATASGESQVAVKRILSELSKLVLANANAGEDTPMPGIGHFETSVSVERSGRNPQTGEALTIPAKRSLKLHVVKSVKDTLTV